MPILIQKIIHSTPLKSRAFFLLYETSVTHISKLFVIHSANHVVLDFVSWSSSIPSHIQFPPQLWRNCQKFFISSGACGNAGLLLSLTTYWLKNPEVEVGSPSCVADESASSRAGWYILVVRVCRCPMTSLE